MLTIENQLLLLKITVVAIAYICYVSARAYPGFSSIRQQGVSPLDVILVYHRLLPKPLLAPIYTQEWREGFKCLAIGHRRTPHAK